LTAPSNSDGAARPSLYIWAPQSRETSRDIDNNEHPDTAGRTVAQSYMAALKACGIRHVFATAAPISRRSSRHPAEPAGRRRHARIRHRAARARRRAMAQGYYLMSGNMAGAMVHVNVGTANTICAVMNAARNNTPMFLASGAHRTPRPATQVPRLLDPLGSGEFRPGGHGARTREVGIRVAPRPADQHGRRPRRRHRHERAQRPGLPSAARELLAVPRPTRPPARGATSAPFRRSPTSMRSSAPPT